MNLWPKSVPISTAGLSPTARCRNLAQRELFRKKRYFTRLREQQWENLVSKAHHSSRGLETCGFYGRDDARGEVDVFGIGGLVKQYSILAGHVQIIVFPDQPTSERPKNTQVP